MLQSITHSLINFHLLGAFHSDVMSNRCDYSHQMAV